jgi:AcrR family transcriptional regulator
VLDALPAVVDEVGFANLTVAKIIAAANLSRPTFYQYFTDVEDCLWAAYHRHSQEMCTAVAAATRRAERPCITALEALASFAQRQPAVAGLLMREGLAAGPSGFIERDALIARVASRHGCLRTRVLRRQ